MKLVPLQKYHHSSLLSFELVNRNWFESLIEPREMDFYSAKGIEEHICQYMASSREGLMYAGVVIKDEEIIGRANLRGINRQASSAYLGYRVAKQHCRKGVATYSVRELANIAVHQFGLRNLIADVLENNIGSMQLLENCGFENTGPNGKKHLINGRKYACLQYCRTIA